MADAAIVDYAKVDFCQFPFHNLLLQAFHEFVCSIGPLIQFGCLSWESPIKGKTSFSSIQ
jgi:hypothetical protein